MVLPEITVITIMVIMLIMHLIGKVITIDIKIVYGSVNIVKMTGNDQLCAYNRPNSRRKKL